VAAVVPSAVLLLATAVAFVLTTATAGCTGVDLAAVRAPGASDVAAGARAAELGTAVFVSTAAGAGLVTMAFVSVAAAGTGWAAVAGRVLIAAGFETLVETIGAVLFVSGAGKADVGALDAVAVDPGSAGRD
jgi:hypothetical protein